MSKRKTICVFCGSSPAVDDKYKKLARDAGQIIARSGFDVIYGGAHIGLMGAVADSAMAHGARVTGIIPHFLKNLEVAHTGLSELQLTETMHERQAGMAERADAFLILPGGLGTLAELFEILTWRQMGLHNKPIALLNAYAYWDLLLNLLNHAEAEKFNRIHDRGLFEVLPDVSRLENFLSGLKK